MNQPPNGGPAFPCPTGSDGGALFEGMTLRDYFAAKIAAGDAAIDGWSNDLSYVKEWSAKRAAVYYAIAHCHDSPKGQVIVC